MEFKRIGAVAMGDVSRKVRWQLDDRNTISRTLFASIHTNRACGFGYNDLLPGFLVHSNTGLATATGVSTQVTKGFGIGLDLIMINDNDPFCLVLGSFLVICAAFVCS